MDNIYVVLRHLMAGTRDSETVIDRLASSRQAAFDHVRSVTIESLHPNCWWEVQETTVDAPWEPLTIEMFDEEGNRLARKPTRTPRKP